MNWAMLHGQYPLVVLFVISSAILSNAESDVLDGSSSVLEGIIKVNTENDILMGMLL